MPSRPPTETAAPCDEYSEWEEMIATWAGDYVYPRDDSEHVHTGAFTSAELPLWALRYPGWVFARYLSEKFGAGVIRRISEAKELQRPTQHVDVAIPGGFRARLAGVRRLRLEPGAAAERARDRPLLPRLGPAPAQDQSAARRGSASAAPERRGREVKVETDADALARVPRRDRHRRRDQTADLRQPAGGRSRTSRSARCCRRPTAAGRTRTGTAASGSSSAATCPSRTSAGSCS